MRSTLVIATVLCLTGCLAAPDPSGDPFDTNDPDPDSGDVVNNEADGGDTPDTPSPDMDSPDSGITAPDADDGDPDCAVCVVEALQCATDSDGNLSLQECKEVSPGCNQWENIKTCVGDQVCTPALGCHCDGETCELGEPLDCPEEGATLCVLINECPRPIDVGRNEGCDVPGAAPAGAPSCADAPQMSYCNTCGDGRGCVASCENDRGWTCGTLPEEP